MSDKNLLPTGFADTLAPAAAQESGTIATLLKCFTQFGYAQVKPPMIEFETSLLTDADESVAAQTFRVMDPESQSMLAIRADMTTQIARIATTRLAEEPRPLRICYAGQVLRVKGEGLHCERQLAQAGIELIGADTIAADAELLTVAIEILFKLGIKNISIDCNLPTLARILKADEALLAALARKDMTQIQSADTPFAELFIALVELAGPADMALEKLTTLDLPKEACTLVERLTAVIDLVKQRYNDIPITLDPLEQGGFEYYTGVSFGIFSTSHADELGRGGRYSIGSNKESAAGFSLAVNAILRSLPTPEVKETIYVPAYTPNTIITSLQEDGLVTILAVDDDTSHETAQRLGCNFIYVDGEKLTVDT